MKTIKNAMAMLLWLFGVSATAQQWTKVENLPETEFTALEIIDGIAFAASGNTLYYSHDNGENWQSALIASTALVPGYFKKFGDTLYLGMQGFGGVYAAPFDHPEGPWVKNGALPEVSSFAEYNGTLYASTMGFGIYRLNANHSWSPFMNGLPNYSYNVSKILATPQSLMVTAGGNGTFYKYNFTTNQWEEDYYGSTYLPGLSIHDAIWADNRLYVSNANRLLRSDDNGANWTPDQSGLLNGLGRFFFKGKKSLYTYTANFNPGNNDNFTYLRKRDINAPSGSSWANDSDFLPFYVYAMGELGNKVYAAAENGLYFKVDATLGTHTPIAAADKIVIYPNPSSDGKFTISSTLHIDEMAIYDISGQLLWVQKDIAELHQFDVPHRGVYLVKVTTRNTVLNFKIATRS